MTNSNQPNGPFNPTPYNGSQSMLTPISGPPNQSNVPSKPPHLAPNSLQPITQPNRESMPHGRRRALAYREARANRGRQGGNHQRNPIPHVSSGHTDIHGFALPNTGSFDAPHMAYSKPQALNQANIHGFSRPSTYDYPAPHTVTSTNSSSSVAWNSNQGPSWHGTVDHGQRQGQDYGVGNAQSQFHIQPPAHSQPHPIQSNQYAPTPGHETGQHRLYSSTVHPVPHIQTQYTTNTTELQPQYHLHVHATPFVPGNTVHPTFSNTRAAMPLTAAQPQTLPSPFAPTQAIMASSTPVSASTQTTALSPFAFAPRGSAPAIRPPETTAPNTRTLVSITPFEASVLRSLHPVSLDEFVEPLDDGDGEHAGEDPWDQSSTPIADAEGEDGDGEGGVEGRGENRPWTWNEVGLEGEKEICREEMVKREGLEERRE